MVSYFTKWITIHYYNVLFDNEIDLNCTRDSPFELTSLPFGVSLSFLCISLLSDTISCSRLIFNTLCLSPGINRFSTSDP